MLQAHVVLTPGSHITLFVPAQKNDKFSQGLFVTLAWISVSGFLIGAWIQRLLSRLKECNLQKPVCLCFCQQWATWATDWFLQECPFRSHRCYAQSHPASSQFLARTQPCWPSSVGIPVAEVVQLTDMAMGCPCIHWRPTGASSPYRASKHTPQPPSFSGYLSLCKCGVRHFSIHLMPSPSSCLFLFAHFALGHFNYLLTT